MESERQSNLHKRVDTVYNSRQNVSSQNSNPVNKSVKININFADAYLSGLDRV